MHVPIPPRARLLLLFVLGIVASACRVETNARDMLESQRTAAADTLRAQFGRLVGATRVEELYDGRDTVLVAEAGSLSMQATPATGLRGAMARARGAGAPEWRWDTLEVRVLGLHSAAVAGRFDQPGVGRGVWTATLGRSKGKWYMVQEHLSVSPTAGAVAGR